MAMLDGLTGATGEFEALLPSAHQAIDILAAHGQPQPEPKGLIDLLCDSHLGEEMVAIERAALYPDGRPQNNAEHSFKLGLMCVSLANSQRRTDLNMDRLMSLSNVHDMPETRGGDTPIVDQDKLRTKKTREQAALALMLTRDFGSNSYMYGLLKEVVECKTPESRFVYAMDKFEPIHFALNTKAKTQRERHDDFPMLVNTQLEKMALDHSVFNLGIHGLVQLGFKWGEWGCKPFDGNPEEIVEVVADELRDKDPSLYTPLILPQ